MQRGVHIRNDGKRCNRHLITIRWFCVFVLFFWFGSTFVATSTVDQSPVYTMLLVVGVARSLPPTQRRLFSSPHFSTNLYKFVPPLAQTQLTQVMVGLAVQTTGWKLLYNNWAILSHNMCICVQSNSATPLPTANRRQLPCCYKIIREHKIRHSSGAHTAKDNVLGIVLLLGIRVRALAMCFHTAYAYVVPYNVYITLYMYDIYLWPGFS